MPDLLKNYNLDESFLANLTSAVQFGFIAGTLVFAVFTVADRFSPSWVFFICSVVAGLFNLGINISGIPVEGLLLFRFFTGFFLHHFFYLFGDKGVGVIHDLACW